jgi:hypothetical protein
MENTTALPQVLSAPGSLALWKVAYAIAIHEQDPRKKPDLCQQARRAINDRYLQQGPYAASPMEKRVLAEALRQLTIHLHLEELTAR